MEDRSAYPLRGAGAPVTGFWAVTPSDSEPLARVASFLYVGAEGDVAIVPVGGGDPVVLTGLMPGVWHQIRYQQVRDTDTTATGILAGD